MILNVLWSPDNLCIPLLTSYRWVWFGISDRKSSFAINNRVWKARWSGHWPFTIAMDLGPHNGLFMISASDDQPWRSGILTTGRRMAYLTKHTGIIRCLPVARWAAWSPLWCWIRRFHLWECDPVVTLSISYVVIETTLMLFPGHQEARESRSAGATDLYICGMHLMGGNPLVLYFPSPSLYSLLYPGLRWHKNRFSGCTMAGIRIWMLLTAQHIKRIYEEHTESITFVAWFR